MQPSDGMILVIGPRLEGHSVIFLAIQTHLSCRFLLAVDSLGLHQPDGMAEETLALELHRTPLLAGARIVVGPFDPAASEARSQRITHRFEISGPDRPGKIVRLSAAFAKCGAEIVRLNSQKSVTGGVAVTTIRIAVSLPDGADTAPVTAATDALGLSCKVETARG